MPTDIPCSEERHGRTYLIWTLNLTPPQERQICYEWNQPKWVLNKIDPYKFFWSWNHHPNTTESAPAQKDRNISCLYKITCNISVPILKQVASSRNRQHWEAASLSWTKNNPKWVWHPSPPKLEWKSVLQVMLRQSSSHHHDSRLHRKVKSLGLEDEEGWLIWV